MTQAAPNPSLNSQNSPDADSPPNDDSAAQRALPLTGERFRAPARLVGAHQKIENPRSVLVLTLLTLFASWLIHPDVGAWWLAYFFLVPWLVGVCTARRARGVYFASWLLGIGYFLFNIRWMAPVTLPGYLALCFYSSLFFPLAAWPIRHMYLRHGVSVAVTAPIVWVATEYLRSLTAVSFPWVLLAHSQYKLISLIQISDLVGAYGVSFVVAMVNGWITDLLIQPILIWRTDQATRLPLGTMSTGVVVLGTLIYGSAQSSRKYFEPGPKVALVQHDFSMHVDTDRATRTPTESVFNSYLALTRRAAEQKPDIIVLPETPLHGLMNDEFINASSTDLNEMQRRRFPATYSPGYLASLQQWSRRSRDAFQQVANEFDVPILMGSLSMEWKPTAIPPRVDAYNSAYLILPDHTSPAARYDKMHLVIFGEYVPFRFSYRWLYDWLNSITPWGRAGIEYSLSPGTSPTVFEFPARSQDGRMYRAAAPICYEEIMPYVPRSFARAAGREGRPKNIDMLLSISNDGWFWHSCELEQHLAGAVFRAVEHRIGIGRSVNTGISAVIHPNGKIHARMKVPPQTQTALEPVATSLTKLDQDTATLEQLADQTSGNDYISNVQAIGSYLRGTIRPQLAAAGPEYVFLVDRLEFLSGALYSTEPAHRHEALVRFRDQIAEDIATLERWRTWPDTAPGYILTDLNCDNRVTIYTRWGDWFGQAAAMLLGMMMLDWMLRRAWRITTGARTKEGPIHAT